MDYKEKLRLAKEALESGSYDKDTIEYIFPELKESKDERNIKDLIDELKGSLRAANCQNDACGGGHEKRIALLEWGIAWLEKQGESKPIGKLQLSEELYEHIRNTCACIDDALSSETLADINDYLSMAKHSAQSAFDMIEKQGEKPQGKSIIEAWKDMRLEVYQQASGNRHEPNCSDDNTKMFSLNDIDEIIEKINEQIEKVDNQNCVKPTDKVEPKFKVGDWLCENEPNNYARFIQILEVVNVQGKERYRISRDIHNDEDIVEADFIEKYYHKFDIKDAKDGDVLVLNGEVFIYAHRKQLYSIAVAHCFIDNAGDFHFDGEFGYVENGNSTYPATQKQRDTLFAKMKDAGYDWDADKKELKKL